MKDYWKQKNIFITGANGFIGSWVAKELVKQGANVTVLIRDTIPNSYLNVSGTAQKVNQIAGSLTDFKLIERIMNEYDIDTCFHLAAQAIVGTANKSPLSTFESNIKGTWNLLEACRVSHHIERIVVASSDKAYGVQKELPYTEDSPLLGRYPYDASKACADILAQSYYMTYNLPIAITRNANTYGGGDLNFSRLIPDAVCKAIKKEQFVMRSDGKFERDYMYIKDAVKAYILLAQGLDKEKVRGEAFNFGTGKPVAAIEVVKKINDITKNSVEPKILSQAKNEIDCQYLSNQKVQNFFGWSPEYDLDTGLQETIEWYKGYLG